MAGRRFTGRSIRWLALLLFPLSRVAAQPRPALSLELPAAESLSVAGPSVRATDVLSDGTLRELLNAGFPARLTHRLELWTSRGVFNSRIGTVTWEVVVRHDPVHRVYEAVRVVRGVATPLGSFPDYPSMMAYLERPWQAPLRGVPGRGPQYYYLELTLEMLSVTDLAELQRWVSGDLRPAVRGERNPGTALSRGARTLLSRLLGGERRSIEARSRRFVL